MRWAPQLLVHDKLIKNVQHPVTSISTFDFGNIIDSIFLIKSLLLALVKECGPIPKEIELIKKLKQEIFSLEKEDRISYFDFANIDNQFYFVLYQQKESERLTAIILKEKFHIDRVLRIFLRQEERYKPIIKIYGNILNSIQSNNLTSASNALGELAKNLEEHVLRAKIYNPEYFSNTKKL